MCIHQQSINQPPIAQHSTLLSVPSRRLALDHTTATLFTPQSLVTMLLLISYFLVMFQVSLLLLCGVHLCFVYIWAELWLSMVSGNGVSPVHRPSYRSYRKMADIGIQYEPQDLELESDFPVVNSTVAEINTSAEIAELDSTTSPPSVNHQNTYHRPLSVQSSSSSSSSSGEERERKKPLTSEELDVDAICVQQSAAEDLAALTGPGPEKTEPDGFLRQDKEESNCGLDCVYFTMQCCECTIL